MIKESVGSVLAPEEFGRWEWDTEWTPDEPDEGIMTKFLQNQGCPVDGLIVVNEFEKFMGEVAYSETHRENSTWFNTEKEAKDWVIKKLQQAGWAIESKSVKESYSGTYIERMFDYMDICDRQGLYDLCTSFIKWMGDDELGQFTRANDLVMVFEGSKQPTEGKLNIMED